MFCKQNSKKLMHKSYCIKNTSDKEMTKLTLTTICCMMLECFKSSIHTTIRVIKDITSPFRHQKWTFERTRIASSQRAWIARSRNVFASFAISSTSIFTLMNLLWVQRSRSSAIYNSLCLSKVLTTALSISAVSIIANLSMIILMLV